MENNDNHVAEQEVEKSSKRRGRSPRKWREIEALKDRYQLQKELYDIDFASDYSLESLADIH